MITINELHSMNRYELMQIIPHLHEQHDAIAYRERGTAHDKIQEFRIVVHPTFPWPHIPLDRDKVDELLLTALDMLDGNHAEQPHGPI